LSSISRRPAQPPRGAPSHERRRPLTRTCRADAIPRTAPRNLVGPVAWARQNLFNNWWNTALTLVLGYFLIRWTIGFIDWAFIQAVWRVPVAANGVADTTACRDARASAPAGR
jgi:general L-amino acid transport system permease protein